MTPSFPTLRSSDLFGVLGFEAANPLYPAILVASDAQRARGQIAPADAPAARRDHRGFVRTIEIADAAVRAAGEVGAARAGQFGRDQIDARGDRKSTRLNSSH